MRKSLLQIMAAALLALPGAMFVGCETEGPAERAGEEIDEAAEEVGDEADDVTDEE